MIVTPRFPIDPADRPHFLVQRIDTSKADDAATPTDAAPCTDEELRPFKLVVDGIDCRISLRPGQQTPWDTREPQGPVIGGAYQQ